MTRRFLFLLTFTLFLALGAAWAYFSAGWVLNPANSAGNPVTFGHQIRSDSATS